MLREVVAEPPLHAGRAVVRRVGFDVGRGDTRDLAIGHVEVHLAADAAVRTHAADHALGPADLFGREALPRHHLEDRAGWADADALAAPRAARFVGIAVGAHDDLGVLAAVGHVEHAHDLDVLARPHAAGAEDAGRHVVANHRIAGALVARAQRQVAARERRGLDLVAGDVALELVARVGVAAVGEVLAGVALEQHTQHAATILDGGV